jgi:hypothetical protein
MCALISKSTPSLSLDIGGTRVLKSINQIGRTWHFSDLPFSYMHEISAREKTSITEEFKNFLEQTKKILAKYNIPSQRFSFLSLAKEYAYTSRLNFQIYDPNKDSDTDYLLRGFTDAIISLEALFNEAPNDISYKIAMRASFILSLTGLSRIETFADIKKAYGYRNDIVHGKKKVELDKEFVDRIQMYAGRSVQCMHALCLKFDGNKQDLIKMMDEAMLVTSKVQDMRQQVKNGLHDFERT